MSYRKDRLFIGKKDAGDVLIFIRDFIVCEQVINQEWENIEIIVCRLLFGRRSVILDCIIPPSSTTYNSKIAELTERISDIYADQHIM